MKCKIGSFSSENLVSFIEANYFPLLNNEHIDNLEPFVIKGFDNSDIDSLVTKFRKYPKFRNVTAEDIIRLRLMLHYRPKETKVEIWCKRLLRYLEINYSKLKENEKAFGREKKVSVLIFNQIIALFVEYYMSNSDLIFLNTSLKLTDMNWILPGVESRNDLKVLSLIKKRQIEAILKSLENG